MSEGRSYSTTWLVSASAVLTLAVGIALARGWEPGIQGEWVWDRNRLPAHLGSAAAAGGLLVAAVGVFCLGGRGEKRRAIWRAVWIAALVLVVWALQWGLLTAAGPLSVSWIAPGAIIASPNATTYFGVSLQVQDVRAWLGSYQAVMPQLPYHARTHPPGFVLLFLSLRRAAAAVISDSDAGLTAIGDYYSRMFGLPLSGSDAVAATAGALGIALIGACGLVPLYLVARRISNDDSATCAVALMAGMPALLLLGASSDLVLMTLAITTLALLYAAWRRRNAALALVAGVVMALGMFFSFAFIVVGVWAMVWAGLGLRASTDRKAAARGMLAGAAAVLVGFGVAYLCLYLATGYKPVAVARAALAAHREVTTVEAGRTYWKWVLMNLGETAIFAGLPLALAAIWSGGVLRRDPALGRWRCFLLSWVIVIGLLDVSGTVRGEVGRIWLFLLWPAAIAAAPLLSRARNRAAVVTALVLLQVCQVMLMRAHLTMYSVL